MSVQAPIVGWWHCGPLHALRKRALMKRLQWSVAVCALLALWVSAAQAQSVDAGKQTTTPKREDPGRSNGPDSGKQQERLLQYMRLRSALFTAPVPCTFTAGTTTCPIPVPVVLVPDPTSGTVYCVAEFPEEIDLPKSDKNNHDKTIVWSLIAPAGAPAGTTFTFFDDRNSVLKAPGIIIV